MATTTTTIDQTNDTTSDPNATLRKHTDQIATPDKDPIADQANRVDELRSDLEIADERSEAARVAYLDGAQSDIDADELRRLRRAWDGARSARNAVESLAMIQDATGPSTRQG